MQKKRKQSVLKRYLITYVGLAVAACAVLGVVLMMVSSNNLKNQEENSVRDRLSSAGEDFSYQLDIMNDLKMQVYLSPLYQPFNLNRNQFNRMETLEHFETLAVSSVITKNYYLVYEDENIVYTTTGVLPLDVFCRFLTPGVSEKELWSQLLTDDKWMALDCTDGMQIYRKLPISFNRYSQNTRAFMLFRIDQAELAQRYESLFRFNGALNLQMDDLYLLGNDRAMANICHEADYHGEKIRIGVHTGEKAASGIYSMLYILIGCTLIFSVISAYLAYRNYSPIRGLASKMQDHAPGAGDEIERIAHAVDHVIELNTATMAQLSESLENASRMKESLKQQLLLLVLSGEYDASMNPRVAELGLSAGKILCAAHITYDAAVNEKELQKLVDGISDSDTNLQLARLGGERGWALLFSARDEENLMVAFDTMNEELGQHFPNVHLTQGEICTQVQKLAYSLAVAESNQNRDSDSPLENAQLYDLLGELKKHLDDGSEIQATSTLERLMDLMDRDYPSLMFRRYRLVDVTHQILECGKNAGCDLEADKLRGAVSMQDGEEIRKTLEEAVKKICAASPKAAVQISAGSRQVMDYIEAHAYDSNICLDSVATACDISTKQVSRIARNVVGMCFKEYVSHLRMRKAMALLKEGLSATDTARMVGYSDISHFTKVFRGHTGVTPGQYRAQYNGDAEEEV